jgi:hypothetical protein
MEYFGIAARSFSRIQEITLTAAQLVGRLHPEGHNLAMRVLRGVYQPILGFALRRRVVALLTAVGLFSIAVPIRRRFGIYASTGRRNGNVHAHYGSQYFVKESNGADGRSRPDHRHGPDVTAITDLSGSAIVLRC